jgi:phosphoribosylanthranilate isomerase
MIRLKICGMGEPRNIVRVAALNPNYLGFIFYEKSLRFANNLSVEVLNNLPPNIEKVAVFVNETVEKIITIAEKYHIHTLQLHGNESPDFCLQLRQKGYTIIKAFNVATQEDIAKIELYLAVIDFALLDAKGKEAGGNGITFDWQLLDFYTFDKPFFLSGGIGLSNIAQVKTLTHPQLYAIDVNSKFEISAGLKDVDLLQQIDKSWHSY